MIPGTWHFEKKKGKTTETERSAVSKGFGEGGMRRRNRGFLGHLNYFAPYYKSGYKSPQILSKLIQYVTSRETH